MWFTKSRPHELYASGEWTNQSRGGEGIASLIASRASDAQASRLDAERGEDVVLWHTFGTTHNPRTEDWPVMPTEKMSVGLKPVNFFERNPGMDLEMSRQSVNRSVRL